MPKRQFHNLPSTQLPKGGNRMVRGWDVLTFSFELRDKIWQNRILGVLRLAVKDRFVSSLDYLRLCLFFIFFFFFVFSSTDWWIHCAMIPSLDEMCVCVCVCVPSTFCTFYNVVTYLQFVSGFVFPRIVFVPLEIQSVFGCNYLNYFYTASRNYCIIETTKAIKIRSKAKWISLAAWQHFSYPFPLDANKSRAEMGLVLVGYEKIKEKQTQIQMETERTRIVNHFMIYHWTRFR